MSSDMLVSRNGSLLLAQHEWIDGEWGDQLRAAFENPPEGCLEFGRTSFGGGAWPETSSETVDRAGAIIYGVVTGIAGGFYGRVHPRLLIQVEVLEWVKRNPDFPERSYFYYPVGDFRVGSIKICKRDPEWPHPPGVGDEVLLFPQITPRGADGTFVRIGQGGVEVVTGNQAGVRITPALSEIEEFRAAISIQELKRLMAEALRER